MVFQGESSPISQQLPTPLFRDEASPEPRERQRFSVPVAAVLVTDFVRGHDIRIIGAPRLVEPNKGQIVCPGGKIEPGETALEAAMRELREESGTTLQRYPVDLLSTHELYVSIRWLAAPLASVIGYLKHCDNSLGPWQAYTANELRSLRPHSDSLLFMWRRLWTPQFSDFIMDVMIRLGHYEEARWDPRYNKHLARWLDAGNTIDTFMG